MKALNMGSGYSTDNNSHTMLPADLALDPYHFIYSSQELCKADSVMIPIWENKGTKMLKKIARG